MEKIFSAILSLNKVDGDGWEWLGVDGSKWELDGSG